MHKKYYAQSPQYESWQVVLVTTGHVLTSCPNHCTIYIYIYILYIIYKTNSVQTNVGKGQSREFMVESVEV